MHLGYLKSIVTRILYCTVALAFTLPDQLPALAQPGPSSTNRVRAAQGPQGPQVIAPEVTSDRHITFRILAPKAENVRLTAGDIPGNSASAEFTKATNGVWEVTIGPIDPGSYRYTFNVDGVATVDPRSPLLSQSNNNNWSLVHVPGADFMDIQAVPHGAVAAVTYFSSSLNKFRRMHVYTPP